MQIHNSPGLIDLVHETFGCQSTICHHNDGVTGRFSTRDGPFRNLPRSTTPVKVAEGRNAHGSDTLVKCAGTS